MKRKLALITGGGTGIGQALAWQLAGCGMDILIVGRREKPLAATQEKFPQTIKTVIADVAEARGREAVAEACGEQPIGYLVHNAAVLEPVEPLAKMTLEAWRQHMAINVEGPLFLTQILLPHLVGGRILHISSGAAHHPYAGWGPYCTSKAALHMVYQVYREELKYKQIAIGSARPGVVDTPMQALIRQTPPDRFPKLERFLQLKENEMLVRPQDAARFLAWLLLDTTDREFSESEWDIGEAEHRWRTFDA
ncbi:MAG: SDR family NAD(P)-dependent oxidoreductase [Pseudomonadota bacterium]|nr:SDR family NAD(P)-dependent oxidoreductase [Pseudomonadota bacterium]